MGKGMANDVVAAAQDTAEQATKGTRKMFGQAPKINMGGANMKPGNVGSVADDVKSKADEAKKSTGGFFGKIAQRGRNALPK